MRLVVPGQNNPKASSSRQILLRIAENEIDVGRSVLTWNELVWVLWKFFGKNVALIQGRKFLEFPNLKFLDVNEIAINKPQDLIDKYGLKPRDAIDAAFALENDIAETLSDDPDFYRVKETRRTSRL